MARRVTTEEKSIAPGKTSQRRPEANSTTLTNGVDSDAAGVEIDTDEFAAPRRFRANTIDDLCSVLPERTRIVTTGGSIRCGASLNR
jgi:hypothetical protein